MRLQVWILRLRRWSCGSPAAGEVDLPELNREMLKAGDFDRRSWGFEERRKRLGRADPHLLHWIGSIDYSGYVRMECLAWLLVHYRPGDENRILLRLTDWVPQVQGLARNWVLRHVDGFDAELIRNNQSLLLYLFRKQRLEDEPALAAIQSRLQAIVRRMEAPAFFQLESGFRRFLYGLCLGELTP